MEISRNTVSTFHPLAPEITKANIASQFAKDEQQLPSLDELKKGGPGSGRKKYLRSGLADITAQQHPETKQWHWKSDPGHGGVSKKLADVIPDYKAAQRKEISERDSLSEKERPIYKEHHKIALAEHGNYATAHHIAFAKTKGIKKAENNDDLQKAEFNTKERKKLAKEGEAESGGSYPIRSEADLHNAISAFGRSKDKAKTKAWIKKRAKELGCEDCLPDTWKKAEDDVTESVGEGAGIEGSLKKGGEGSKGGKVIGHTSTGKPIYEHGTLGAHYKNFTPAEHREAHNIHKERGEHKIALGHKNEANHKEYNEKRKNNKVQKAFDSIMGTDINPIQKAFDMIQKGGEGSKGGKVIGHTKGGKAVYAHKEANHKDHKGWSSHDHDEASNIHKKEFDKHYVKARKLSEKDTGEDDNISRELKEARQTYAHHYKQSKEHAKLALKKQDDYLEGRNKTSHED